ncbi:PIN domain-containing protein [Treponema denticola]|uniref:PIN domain-containing protein n=1 Tax=Treponema denticola TaxID=158 RepID=A0A9Q9BJZ7_TREDN|nr:PIN domain-containing protein [Treponema denticola]UTC91427.1 PIN domain-containing protein [Treponema denticola]UTC99218.1 PIN domain-containing protein [Treponema denticola]
MKLMQHEEENRVPLYAVIDTNVLVSAFLKENSIPRFVINYMYAGKIIPIYNKVETFVVTPRQILDLLEKPI